MEGTPWDAVVVGGGPAGSATAARMAAAGLRVMVLDRATFPRPKPCGECLSPAAVEALGRLGVLDRVLGAGAAPVKGWRIHAGEAAPFEGRFPAERPGLALSRDRLDALLLNHARESGAEVRPEARVVELERDGGRIAGVRLVTGEVVRARVVVGADGLRSVVVRRLGLLRRAPRLRKVALTAHL
jgi:flavin-dependent dehydrogenase